MNAVRYKHTQTGYVVSVPLGAGLVLCLALVIATREWSGLIACAALAVALGLFSSLTVEVGADRLRLRFGPGVVLKSFPLAEIAAARPVTNTVWHGWGIHWLPGGWVYNVSGWRAVEIEMRNGRKARIGTDEPEALAQAIEAAKGG